MVSFSRVMRLGLFSLILGALPVVAASAPAPLTASLPTISACGTGASVAIDLEGLLEEPALTPADWEVESPLFASCSGENCGCYDPPCTSECDSGDFACIRACTRAQVRCAVCCCTPPEFQPPYC